MKTQLLVAAYLLSIVPTSIWALDTVTLQSGKEIKCQVTAYDDGVVKLRLPSGRVRRGKISGLKHIAFDRFIEFNTDMELSVYEIWRGKREHREQPMWQKGKEDNRQKLGTTPRERPLLIPASAHWKIGYTGYGPVDWRGLRQVLQQYDVPGLILPDPDKFDPAQLTHLKRIQSLHEVQFGRNRDVAELLPYLADIPNLRILEIPFVKITATELQQIGKMHNLRRLFMENITNEITAKGLAHLTGLKNLRWLDLEHINVTDKGLAHLATLQNLRRLNIAGADISDKGLAHVAKLKKLRRLDISNVSTTTKGLKHLIKLEKLRWLEIDDADLDDEDYVKLAKLDSLQYLLPPRRFHEKTNKKLQHKIKGLEIINK